MKLWNILTALFMIPSINDRNGGRSLPAEN